MEAGALSGLRVLVVEDEELIVLLLTEQLQALGCVPVATATGLEDALEKARSVDVDLAVLDLSLAGRNSAPVASILRAREIPFVVATGYGVEGIPDPLRDRPLLRKPYRREQLASALKEAAAR